MNNQLNNTLTLASFFLLLFGLAELLHHRFKIKADTTRKIVHIGTGLLCMLFPVMLQSQWYVLLLCSSFGTMLLLSLKFGLLRSINAIDRVSYGSLLYPVIVYTCFLVYNYHLNDHLYFYVPLLVMAICDPIAAIFGKTWPYGKFYIGRDKKTVTGSTAFFLSAFLITVVLFRFLLHSQISAGRLFLVTLLIASATTVVEAVSIKGLDNLTIPLSVIIILILVHV